MYFNIVGTNTHQPKIIDLQQFTNVNYQYYSWIWEDLKFFIILR